MRAKPWQTCGILKPSSLPYFYAGLRVSVSYAFITTVVSEWLGGFEGLGVHMIQSKKLFQYDTCLHYYSGIDYQSFGYEVG